MPPFQRSYPIEADIEVWVSPLDAKAVTASWAWALEHGFIEASLPAHEFLARQQALLDALLADAPRLDLWLKGEALDHLLDMGIEEEPLYTREEDIFAPVIAALPDRHRRYFERAVQNEEFHEYAQALFLAVHSDVRSVAVAENPWTRRDGRGAAVRRDIRVLIEVETQLGEIDRDLARETWRGIPRWSEADVQGPGWRRWITAQERLREALLRDDAALDLWFSLESLREVAELDPDSIRIPLHGERPLYGVVPSLSEPARSYFEDGILTGKFYELAPDVDCALGSRVVGVQVAGVPAGPGPLVG